MNRRGFIKRLVAGSASIPFILETLPRITGADPVLNPVIVIHDARYSDARCFAAEAVRLGAAPLVSQQDMIRLWYDRLGRYLENPELRIMGMTAYNDFLLLRSCTAELKRMVVFEGFHDCRGGTTLIHTLRHSDVDEPYLLQKGPDWPALLAKALFYKNTSKPALRETVVATTTQRAPDHPGTLVSWLIV